MFGNYIDLCDFLLTAFIFISLVYSVVAIILSVQIKEWTFLLIGIISLLRALSYPKSHQQLGSIGLSCIDSLIFGTASIFFAFHDWTFAIAMISCECGVRILRQLTKWMVCRIGGCIDSDFPFPDTSIWVHYLHAIVDICAIFYCKWFCYSF